MRALLAGSFLIATHSALPGGAADGAVFLGLALAAIGFGRILGNHLHQ